MDTMKEVSPNSSDWDHYWKLQARGQKAYGFIANFYRKRIIKRTLNYHISNSYAENSLLLHAGSGSGEVDLDICQSMNVVAIDFLRVHSLRIPNVTPMQDYWLRLIFFACHFLIVLLMVFSI